MSQKKVTFSDTVEVFETYGPLEYDRSMIDSVFYKKCLRRVPDEKWKGILLQLNFFKANYMMIHKSNINSIVFHRPKNS